MKHAKIFAGVMGVILSGVAARAEDTFPADTATYPTYQVGQQTADTNGDSTDENFAEGALKDKNIKLATTKYLDKQANTVNSDVQTLNNTANTDNATVMANKTDIEEMTSDRQVVAGNPCATLANDEIACGYIVPEGTTITNNDAQKHVKANYNWVKIIATVDAVTAANGSSSGSSGA